MQVVIENDAKVCVDGLNGMRVPDCWLIGP